LKRKRTRGKDDSTERLGIPRDISMETLRGQMKKNSFCGLFLRTAFSAFFQDVFKSLVVRMEGSREPE